MASPADAAAAANSLIYDLNYQYTLAYTPTKPHDGKYRRITVESTLPGLWSRHRGGYLALPTTEP